MKNKLSVIIGVVAIVVGLLVIALLGPFGSHFVLTNDSGNVLSSVNYVALVLGIIIAIGGVVAVIKSVRTKK